MTDSSDTEFSPGIKGLFIQPVGVYQHTRTRTGAVIPFDYKQLMSLTDSDDEDEHSAVGGSQASSSIRGGHAHVHMAGVSEDVALKLEAQQAALEAQQETINIMKGMLEQLLKKKKSKRSVAKPSPKPSSSKQKGKGKGKTPPTTETEEGHVSSASSSTEKSAESVHSEIKPNDKRMEDFQIQLDALKLKKELGELGITRPYPIEWDTISYPPRFKPMSLASFDGKGSPTQHIYYFLSQTGLITGNDPIMTRLFIGTLKGVAFEWFRRLEPGSIKTWADMEKLFLARFFDDDTEVSMSTLLAEK